MVIVVDDGMATGATMMVAVDAVRQYAPREIVIATPVASSSAYDALRRSADHCIALLVSDRFYGVGAYYRDFSQTTDGEVRRLLAHAQPAAGAAGSPQDAGRDQSRGPPPPRGGMNGRVVGGRDGDRPDGSVEGTRISRVNRHAG